MKNTLLVLAALAMVAVTGCNQSNDNADQTPAPDTNTTVQKVETGASNAWQSTKTGASNAWEDTKSGATNAWNKTTNAVVGSSTNQ